MSERNLGVFLPGHIPADAVDAALARALPPDARAGRQVGHGERGGRPYTHLGLPVLEGGMLLFSGPVQEDDLELALGRALSEDFGEAVFLQYDDELGWGGHARFEGGALASLEAIDGRELDAVRRTLAGEAILDALDPSDWIWPLLGAAVEAGAAALLGPGVCTDDDIAALIEGAGDRTPPPPGEREPGPPGQIRPQDSGDSGRLQRLVHRLRKR